MQPELTLNLKCPACGSLTPKTLSQIKAQKTFECDCGYHVDLQPVATAKPRRQAQQRTGKAVATA